MARARSRHRPEKISTRLTRSDVPFRANIRVGFVVGMLVGQGTECRGVQQL